MHGYSLRMPFCSTTTSSRFGVNIVYNLSDPKEMEEDLSLLSKAMKLLQLDYLGGHGAPLQMEPLVLPQRSL